MPSPPQISVVIPAYNASKTIAQCLEAIAKQDFSDAYEVIVVNDGSTDNTANIVSKFKNAKLISQENAGPASARNIGARQAKGGIIVFMDSDCIATKGFLGEIVKPFENPEVSGVQGAYLCRERGLMGRFGQLEIEQRYEKMKRQKYIDFMGSYAAAYRRKVFMEFGGFDDSFPIASGEDTDLSFRISSAGHKFVFNPMASVYHFHPASLWKYLRVKFFRGYWRVLVYKKHSRKVLADSYTSQTIKMQMALGYVFALGAVAALPALVLGFSIAAEGALLASAAAFALLLASTLRFFLFAMQRDAAIAFFSIPVQLLRTFALCAGLAYGMTKASVGKL